MKDQQHGFIVDKSSAILRLPSPVDSLALMYTAYLMTAAAYVSLRQTSEETLVVLTPKKNQKFADLRSEFKREYSNQLIRWRLERKNRKMRLKFLENIAPSNANTPSLALESNSSIGCPIDGAYFSQDDPLEIRTPWEVARNKR